MFKLPIPVITPGNNFENNNKNLPERIIESILYASLPIATYIVAIFVTHYT